jgi:hypothetical protein
MEAHVQEALAQGFLHPSRRREVSTPVSITGY